MKNRINAFMKKCGFVISIVCLIVLALVLIFSNSGEEKLIGGDQDEHGCYLMINVSRSITLH